MKNQLFLRSLKCKGLVVLFLVFKSCISHTELDIQGHRGCRGLLPENSLPAFEMAIELGVNTLELDIAITKDNKVVVSHEPFMSRTICYNPSGGVIPEEMDMAYNLFQMTYNDIKVFDCGTKFHSGYPNQEKISVYKPLLSEVFDLVKSKKSEVNFNIELKSKPSYYGIYTPYPEEYVEIVLEEIKVNDMFSTVSLQSFDLKVLEEIKKQSPKMKVALLVDEDEDIDEKLNKLSYKPEIISPFFKLLTSKIVKNYHAEGYQIIPWTVNDIEDMEHMISLKVDGIITDYPNELLKLTAKSY